MTYFIGGIYAYKGLLLVRKNKRKKNSSSFDVLKFLSLFPRNKKSNLAFNVLDFWRVPCVGDSAREHPRSK
jgi:hypothetical protein